MMKSVAIQYDGKVDVSSFGTFNLGEYALKDVINKALGMGTAEWRTMNARVKIHIEMKPDEPLVIIGGDC